MPRQSLIDTTGALHPIIAPEKNHKPMGEETCRLDQPEGGEEGRSLADEVYKRKNSRLAWEKVKKDEWGRRGYRELRKRGVSRRLAWNTAKFAHGPWRISRSPTLAIALPGRFSFQEAVKVFYEPLSATFGPRLSFFLGVISL